MKKEFLNSIENSLLIKINKQTDFTYLEEDLKIDSPVSYYFKYSDLSINSNLSLKWSLYGFFFFRSLIETLDDSSYTDDISFSNSIDSDFYNLKRKKKKIFTIDDVIMDNDLLFKQEFETTYKQLYYSENSKVHFKIKLNAFEYIILQNILFPKLVFYSQD